MADEFDSGEKALPLTEAAKEQIKFRASWLNGLSVATFAVGTLASTSRALFQSGLNLSEVFQSILVGLICLAIAFILHIRAYATLKGLDQ
ncbi:hypothetical protein [Jiella mangrovi]|uniref:Amino acid transporter n=1 Tax=Jiella mangrovi TaxID=2821407 RepID=A0ABS4BEW4_9HYPH|nr:hypothetical protein [Jiella mangrovi]MBP0615293.1 hypothetical protein [Jiella mangrovi]